jgi:hypothetical protein
LEFVLLFFRKGDDSDELSFESGEVGSDDADGDSEGLPEGFKFAHFLFHVDLDDGGAFVNVGAFVKFDVLSLVLFSHISFLDDGDRLSSQCALIY